MELLKILGVGLLTCVASLILKQIKPDIASIVAIAGGVVILIMLVDYISQIFNVFNTFIL